ncbi:MAG: M20 family metallopeptidase [Acidimicrobiia bacterium]|nr:M20 family metallopeptidase [Acidimicrobiia bacterium]
MDDMASSLVDQLDRLRGDQLDLLRRLVLSESPSLVPTAHDNILAMLTAELEALDLDVEYLPGEETGGHLLARTPAGADGGQLLIGHCDTVWPLGTLSHMPLETDGGRMRGPGIYDMKAGLTQIIFALRALQEVGVTPALPPIVFINSDEEIGSRESKPRIMELARQVERALVLEPSLGPSGKLKTARKGVGRFMITVKGRAAHAGLDPEAGASAILELSFLIQQLFALNDPGRGITVNVGMIDGGLRPNVVAPNSTATVDVRVLHQEDVPGIEEAIHGLQPSTDGIELEIQGRIGRLPLEHNDRNRTLWKLAQECGNSLGMQLEEGTAGGGSDGNHTTLHTATLDGLGAVGDGAHAQHEYIDIEATLDRTALLALLLATPA